MTDARFTDATPNEAYAEIARVWDAVHEHSTDWQPIDEAPRHAMLRLLVRGVQRMGEWSEARQCWVSAIDSRIRLRPTHYKDWPVSEA
jgi:hypothetical protein